MLACGPACTGRAPRSGSSLLLRPARDQDQPLVFSWLDRPAVRALVAVERLSEAEHLVWFGVALVTGEPELLLAEQGSEPVAFASLEAAPDSREAHLSLQVAPQQRGRGIGTVVLQALIDHARTRVGLDRLVALVRPENEASQRLFEKAGFTLAADLQLGGRAALRYVLQIAEPAGESRV